MVSTGTLDATDLHGEGVRKGDGGVDQKDASSILVLELRRDLRRLGEVFPDAAELSPARSLNLSPSSGPGHHDALLFAQDLARSPRGGYW